MGTMIFRFLFLIIIVIIGGCTIVDGIVIQRTPTQSIGADRPLKYDGDGGGGSSHDHIAAPLETESFNFTREILSPKREDGFFNESSEVITVLAKVVPLSKDGLKNLEIWEIPSNGLEIENCSYPLRTSKIIDLLEYRASDKSSIQYKDISKIKYIKEKLNSTNPDPLYSHIYSLLNNSTKELLAQNDSENDAKLYAEILNDFNAIINRPTDQDLNISHLAGSEVIPRSKVQLGGIDKALLQVFNNNSDSFLPMNDYRLFKRRLLEDAFPKSIKRVIYYKDHEDYKLRYSNIIMIGKKEIGESDLKEGESIIFKYYLHPKELGVSEIRSIIRADGFYHEEVNSIKIIEREPRFDVTYQVPSKEIEKYEWEEFIYYIKYLGGDEDEKIFDISFNPVINKATNRPFFEVNTSEMNKRIFKRGKTEIFNVSVKYLEEGNHLSPPTVSIDGKEERMEADLSVYERENLKDKLHFESDANKIARYLLYATAASLFLLLIELWMTINIKKEYKLFKLQFNNINYKLARVLNKNRPKY